MTRPKTVRADVLLDELGIRTPEEIDIEMIAQFTGATVVYESLSGCAGRILGHGERAFITVDENSGRARQRFSAAHELGHWMRDRDHVNAAFTCTAKTIAAAWGGGGTSRERLANKFAANLLMPRAMFRDDAYNLDVTLETVDKLRRRYRTSLTATAIRLVELSNLPGMVLLFERGGGRWRWFAKTDDLVPSQIWPRDLPGLGSTAGKLLDNVAVTQTVQTEVRASEWFLDEEADGFYVLEDTRYLGQNAILSLLWWKDEEHLMGYLAAKGGA